jgi:hypothetical protein
MNLRSYYPDFIAMDEKGTRWISQPKVGKTGDVLYKDAAATQWCFQAMAQLVVPQGPYGNHKQIVTKILTSLDQVQKKGVAI